MSDPTRRTVVASATALAIPGVALAAAPVVTMLGDSLTAGYGLPANQSLPVQLQASLDRLGVAAKIRGAGVSGDNTGTALRRLDRAVPDDTKICIVALGANDLLQIAPPAQTQANLDQIISKLKGRGIKVLLVGVGAPVELGPYSRTFNKVYVDLAKKHGVTLYPDILAGVARNPALNQPDRIHPNAQGVAVIAERLAPVVRAAILAR